MDIKTLHHLELLNQLALTEEEKAAFLALYAEREETWEELAAIDTEDTERMVHVMPIMTVVREDVARQLFTREELQAAAPDAGEGYWRVPRVLD